VINISASKFLFKDIDSDDAITYREQIEDTDMEDEEMKDDEQNPINFISDFDSSLRRLECPDQQFKQSDIFNSSLKIESLFSTLPSDN